MEKQPEAKLAKVRGRSKSEVVREAIVRLIEDQEDLELAEPVREDAASTPS